MQFHALQYDVLAELMGLLVENQAVRRRSLRPRRRRLDEFAPARVEERLRGVLCRGAMVGVGARGGDRRLTMRVHQMTATLTFGDAVSNDIFEIDRRLKAWGLDGYIYAEHIDPRVADLCHSDAAYARFLDETDDLLIYHYSIYTPNLELYKRTRNRKIVIYHNITPPEFFRGIDSGLEAICRTGRLMLGDLRGCELALADSDFNRRELVAAGLPEEDTGVLPIFLSLEKFANSRRDARALSTSAPKRSSQSALRRPAGAQQGLRRPNQDAVCLSKSIYPDAHLWLVGDRSLLIYTQYLEKLVARLACRMR